MEKLQQELDLHGLDTMAAPVTKDSVTPQSAKRIATFGKYAQLEFLGQGGMARVYKAHDPTLGRMVALKFMKTEDPHLTDRLLREARSQARIDQEHVCKIYETSEVEGKPYIAMQYIPGRTLKQLKDGFSLQQKVNLIRQVCEGVHAAHKAGLIHRDLKPTNIMIEQGEAGPAAYVMDFGLAREIQAPTLTMTGLVVGTPSYMSPEQAQGQADTIDSRTDIYSIGATLYEMITGRPPFEGASTTEILMKVVGQDPVAPRKIEPSLSVDLQTIVLKCLEKNPERRYTSVRSLSDDLSRFLDGDPVLARPATWMYRANKKIRKHPAIAGLLAFAFLAVAIFAVTAGLVQWRAKEQAKLFQEFGEQVTEMQAIMRYAYLLPLHDVQDEKKQVAERLEHINSRMKILRNVSYAPGNYSLGRGYLSLHRYQDAYDHLLEAWQKYNYRKPAVANALGLSLAMLYQEKTREAERTYSKDKLKARKEELEKQYSAPALQYIQWGSSASESPEYVAALISFLGKKYPEALIQSEAASRRISWLYESQILQGHIYKAMGNEHREKGESVLAGEFYEKAKNAYFSAAKKGQSDPEAYEGLCAVHGSIQEMLLTQKGDSPEAILKEGIGYCEKALQADSKFISANLIASRIYRDWATNETNHGKDCSESSEKAADLAKAVLKIESENGMAYRALGDAYSIRANGELQKQGNVAPFLDLANSNLEKASAKMPEDDELLFNLGFNYIKRAEYEIYSGKDPTLSLEKAIGFIQKCIVLNSKNYKYHGRLGTAYYNKGVYEGGHGLDSTPSLKLAISCFQKSMALNPQIFNNYWYTANSYLVMAEGQIRRNENAVPALNEAVAVFKKSLTIDPENAFSYSGLAMTFWNKGHVLQLEKKDPTTELEKAREAFRKSVQINKLKISNYALWAEVELVAARHAIDNHMTPEPFFEEAKRILQGCFAITADSSECLESLAALHVLRAEHLVSLRQSPDKEIRAGIKACDRALEKSPENQYVHNYRGRLFLFRARSLSGPDRKGAAQEARASMDHAFKLDPSFKKEYEKDYEEATLLADN